MTNPPPIEPSNQPAEPERPRFGEYAPASAQRDAAASTTPPQHTPPQPQNPYGQQPQNPYGQQPQYPVQNQPQQPYAQQPLYSHQNPYGMPPGAPKPKGVGVVAFVVGLIVLIASPIVVALTSSVFAPVLEKSYTGPGSIDPNLLSDADVSQIGGASVGFTAYLVVGTILGLWALIQGIVAAARNRGRVFGILAIVFAVVAPIVGIITFYAVLLTSAPGLIDKISQGS